MQIQDDWVSPPLDQAEPASGRQWKAAQQLSLEQQQPDGKWLEIYRIKASRLSKVS